MRPTNDDAQGVLTHHHEAVVANGPGHVAQRPGHARRGHAVDALAVDHPESGRHPQRHVDPPWALYESHADGRGGAQDPGAAELPQRRDCAARPRRGHWARAPAPAHQCACGHGHELVPRPDHCLDPGASSLSCSKKKLMGQTLWGAGGASVRSPETEAPIASTTITARRDLVATSIKFTRPKSDLLMVRGAQPSGHCGMPGRTHEVPCRFRCPGID
ncbi:hypothetical protein Pelo_19260 [Pelomyxa schiedti]|nr:hypothetical protein Pelo_19260 [Pelomyxa schiedti]